MIHEQTRLSKKGASGMAIRLRGNVLKVRPLLAFIMLASGFAFSNSAVAQADLAPSQPVLDAVCKAAPMPAGYVAVGEIENPDPECGTSSPGHKNAWLIDKVHDKIISCTPPDYAFGYPPAIAYMICQRVSTPQCPPTLDGTANAYELAQGKSCTSSRVVTLCWDYNEKGVPSNLVRPPTLDFKNFKIDVNEELVFWKLSVVKGDPDCAKSKNGADRTNYVVKLAKAEPLPLCSELNSYALTYRIPWHNWFGHVAKIIVIRKFYTDACPEYAVNGQVQRLNAFVVQRLEKEDWLNQKVFMCSSIIKETGQGTLARHPWVGRDA